MLELTFITGNETKLAQAQAALQGYPITLTNQKIETPEIQSTDCEEIAKYSAKFACEQLGKPVVTTDAGFYINTLNGFPGPFIKFINKWLSPQDLLNLMQGKEDRTVESPVCVAYCEPGKEPISFIAQNKGSLAEKASGTGSTIDQLYIPNGYNVPIGELNEQERLTLWSIECWKKLAEYLLND